MLVELKEKESLISELNNIIDFPNNKIKKNTIVN